MKICDVCRSGDKVTMINIKIDFADAKYNIADNLDVCEQCRDYVSINSLIIGINEQLKHRTS